MSFENIIVTGCGGDIGISIGRILKISNVSNRVIGCDVNEEHGGSAFFDVCEIVERADSRFYIERMLDVCKKYSVGLIIPTSEPELRFFFNEDLLGALDGIPVLVVNKKALTIGFDKALTVDLLKSSGLPYPWTTLVSEGIPKAFPCIIKKRYGAGSKEVMIVEEEVVDYYSTKRPDDLWQEYLSPDDQEYTCGLYRSKAGEVRTIILKRRLDGSLTVYGEVRKNMEIEVMLNRLAELLDLRGSINPQLRLTERGPVIFEINPRFSSTVMFRHLLGFKDLLWSISEIAGKEIEDYVAPQVGTRFYRASQEVILQGIS
jgi:carbamoyl-phosphate synthase large subunit